MLRESDRWFASSQSYIAKNQLFDKFKHKEILELSDLVQAIKDEFDVNV
ncbi:MAG: hypothetical protein ACYCVD_02995 [Desulfitobacteriaceae bacterium]